MKKLLIAAAIVVGLLSLRAYCATNQPQSIGSVKISKASIDTLTLTQINALTADTTGQMVGCSNCVMSPICISSGSTAAGQWTVMQATAAAPTTPLHCQ